MTDENERRQMYRATYRPRIAIRVKKYPIIQQFNSGNLIYQSPTGREVEEQSQCDSHEWFQSEKDALRAAHDEAERAIRQLETELREVQTIRKRLASEIGVNSV